MSGVIGRITAHDAQGIRQNRVVLTPPAGVKSAEAKVDPTGRRASQEIPQTTVAQRVTGERTA